MTVTLCVYFTFGRAQLNVTLSFTFQQSSKRFDQIWNAQRNVSHALLIIIISFNRNYRFSLLFAHLL